MTNTRIIALVALALATFGCAQNSVLEIEMQLPTRAAGGSSGAPDALVRVALDTDGPENDGATFDAWNDGSAASIPSALAFSLSQNRCAESPQRTFPCNVRMSLATTNVDADAIVQIRFCNAALGTCDENAPELRYHVEHPFYRGQRTFFRTGPASATTGSYTYNLSDDFPELCEQPPSVDLATRVIWRCRIEGCFDSTRGQFPSPDYGWCVTATGPSFGISDACTLGDGAPPDAGDAGERVVGVISGHPQHECELHASSCSVSLVGARGGRGLAAGLALGLALLARRRRVRR